MKEQTYEIKIGDMTYIIVSHCDENAKENVIEKIERLILRDIKKIG